MKTNYEDALRDRIALEAMKHLIPLPYFGDDKFAAVAVNAYAYADAMLLERKKRLTK